MDKNRIRLDSRKFLKQFGKNINAKFSNICAKTGQYNVPSELFQKRTPRSNRVLIEWKVVNDNHLTMEQLKSFSGGVVVEFLNNDFFDESYSSNPLYNELKNKIGSDEIVSSIISIHSEAGSSSSEIQRQSFKKLINNTNILYKGTKVIINEKNYQQYAIEQIRDNGRGIGVGNEWWNGFLFISIKGGQQDTIETHHDQELTLFNPACEFANKEVCLDLDLVMLYFAFLSVPYKDLDEYDAISYDTLFKQLKEALKGAFYDSPAYKGNLLDYCENHPSAKMQKGTLTDPIQIKRIDINKFDISERTAESIDFTHDEAVIFQRYYWDNIKKCILSPARPSNVFWSYHLSNMMQQDYSLEDYFKYEEERFKSRQRLLGLQS